LVETQTTKFTIQTADEHLIQKFKLTTDSDNDVNQSLSGHIFWNFQNKLQQPSKTRRRAIAGRTVRCRHKFRYVYAFLVGLCLPTAV